MSTNKPAGVRSYAKAAIRSGALIGATMLAAHAQAQESDEKAEETVYVYGRAVKLGEKYTAPLVDTPQTITIVPREVIDQQNLLTVRDILTTLPGITFGAGEGGGGYGDSINLRGYSANNDITIDGLRDSAQYSRTDPFNMEQLQLVSGANSVYAGVGSVGGSINIVTKRPTGMDGTTISLGAGTDEYARVTVDAEKALSDVVWTRLNLMAHKNDVPGRRVETFERWGVAPSALFQLGSSTSLTLAYVHQTDDNIPQYGVPYALGPFNDGQLPGAPLDAYYGYSNVDRQEIDLDALTAIVEHELTGSIELRNLTRLQQVDQLSRVSPPQGTWCVEPEINPWTGAPCSNPGVFLPQPATPQPPTTTGPRGTTRDTTNDILVNQTDLTAQFSTGAIEHTLVAGLVFSKETYERLSGNSLRGPNGEIPVLPPIDMASPDHIYTGPINFIPNQRVESEVRNQAVYAFDRLQLTDWLEVNGGVRFEHNEGEFTLVDPASPPAGPVTPAENEDDLFSYRLGVVFKPTSSSSIYFAHGNSSTPSQATVNAGCNTTENCGVDPEEALNYELGAKWDAMSGDLSLTAAVFRNERTNFRVNSNDPTEPLEQLDGESRVDGVTLGVTGAVTDRLTVFANYTFLDSEVIQGVSDFCVDNPDAEGCELGGNSNLVPGSPLPATPEHSGSVWATYQITQDLLVGYGATYTGEMTFNRASAASPSFYTDDYWVHRAMAAYEVTDNLAVQLNVNNLTDEEYFARIRNNATNGWATPGDARSAVLSLTYKR